MGRNGYGKIIGSLLRTPGQLELEMPLKLATVSEVVTMKGAELEKEPDLDFFLYSVFAFIWPQETNTIF